MKKLKKFIVNENAYVLSPEEMRMISGGSDVTCREGGCYVINTHYYGYCIHYNGSCACELDDGRIIQPKNSSNNACIISASN